MEKMSVMSLHSILEAFGDIIELDYKIDTERAIEELKNLNTWIDSTNGKHAVNLTGPIEDIGLDSPASEKHARGQSYNENLLKCPTIKEFFDHWTELARCRAAWLSAGSFFRPHRDAFRFNDQFRLFIPLNNTAEDQMIFTHADRVITTFKPGVPYILNTRKVHGSACMTDNTYQILMSIFLNEHNVKTITNMLPYCREY